MINSPNSSSPIFSGSVKAEDKLTKNNALRGAVLSLMIIFISTCQIQNKPHLKYQRANDKTDLLAKVDSVDLNTIDPDLFAKEEWFVPYYLKHFSRVANSVVESGPDKGFINISVWRTPRDNQPYNARIMENILSLAWFYTRNRPWNPYYGDPALKARMEAALTFWCNIQNDDGRFSEYATGRWGLAPTAFATKFVGMALYLLYEGPPIAGEVFERTRQAMRKALYISFTDAGLWEHGRSYTNQYANLWGGALMYLKLWPDPEIDRLFRKRLEESMTAFQSPCGFFYERNGPDWGYNLSTHHSDLHVAWHFAKGTDLEHYFIEKTQAWYEWFSYNAVKELDQPVYYLNKAIETRQNQWIYVTDTLEDPAYARWAPQAEEVPVAHPFQLSREDYDALVWEKYEAMRKDYPEVAEFKPGEFRAFSPYAFLHNDLLMWFPSEQQKQEAIEKLPYLENDNFIQVRKDPRSHTTYAFVRRPAYYAVFNAGKIINPQQRFGLGLLWSPEMGTVLQSQSETDVAAWGTQASGNEQVYEAGDIQPEIRVNGKTWESKESLHELGATPFKVTYALGDKGSKTFDFTDDTLKISVQHSGRFKEVLPILVAEDVTMEWNDQMINLQGEKGIMTIYFRPPVKLNAPESFMQIGSKICKVFEVETENHLDYKIVFN